MKVIFITWNKYKAEYLSKYLWYDVKHQKVNLEEIQSLDLQEIVSYKLEKAYQIVKKPVLVEDVSLEFIALGKLPGTYIKWFIEELNFQQVCNLIDGKERWAIARCVFWFYDGKEKRFFEGSMKWKVPFSPSGDNGFGRDPIFVPEWYNCTRAELSEEDNKKTYLMIKPFEQLKIFLESRE